MTDDQSKPEDKQTRPNGSNLDPDNRLSQMLEATGTGGNMIFSPGNGAPSGSIVIELSDGSEMIRFDHDGKVYVRGEQVDDNQGIYMHFRRWLELSRVIPADQGANHER